MRFIHTRWLTSFLNTTWSAFILESSTNGNKKYFAGLLWPALSSVLKSFIEKLTILKYWRLVDENSDDNNDDNFNRDVSNDELYIISVYWCAHTVNIINSIIDTVDSLWTYFCTDCPPETQATSWHTGLAGVRQVQSDKGVGIDSDGRGLSRCSVGYVMNPRTNVGVMWHYPEWSVWNKYF